MAQLKIEMRDMLNKTLTLVYWARILTKKKSEYQERMTFKNDSSKCLSLIDDVIEKWSFANIS